MKTGLDGRDDVGDVAAGHDLSRFVGAVVERHQRTVRRVPTADLRAHATAHLAKQSVNQNLFYN